MVPVLDSVASIQVPKPGILEVERSTIGIIFLPVLR
jgi:hypothetical protein